VSRCAWYERKKDIVSAYVLFLDKSCIRVSAIFYVRLRVEGRVRKALTRRYPLGEGWCAEWVCIRVGLERAAKRAEGDALDAYAVTEEEGDVG